MVSCPGLSVKPLIPRRRHAARKTAGRSLVTGVEKAALQRPPLPEPARDCPPCRNGEWQGRRERRSPAARQWQFRHCPQRAPVVGWTAGRTRPVRNKLPSPPKKRLTLSRLSEKFSPKEGRHHVSILCTVLFLLFGFTLVGPGSDVLCVDESSVTSAVVKDSRRPRRAGGFFVPHQRREKVHVCVSYGWLHRCHPAFHAPCLRPFPCSAAARSESAENVRRAPP